jgi:vesicle transport through interaction with t-SNAREs protein 1
MDSSPTSLFDSYEQDFQQILQSIREKLEGDGSDQRGGRVTDISCQSLT